MTEQDTLHDFLVYLGSKMSRPLSVDKDYWYFDAMRKVWVVCPFDGPAYEMPNREAK